MRNGNDLAFVLFQVAQYTFNRIYEEWKPDGALVDGFFKASSIESMRNGNYSVSGERMRILLVQSNLWGMETFRIVFQDFINKVFNRIYEEWKLLDENLVHCVTDSSIESMRNGNRCIRFRERDAQSVQSNLWGMETLDHIPRPRSRLQFNRIYEEWKPRFRFNAINISFSFNRIYEEWKPMKSDSDLRLTIRSIESMRNGNKFL